MEKVSVKVIIRDGIVEEVLANRNFPLDIEIVDINKDYDDVRYLEAYTSRLYENEEYREMPFTVAHDTEEE